VRREHSRSTAPNRPPSLVICASAGWGIGRVRGVIVTIGGVVRESCAFSRVVTVRPVSVLACRSAGRGFAW